MSEALGGTGVVKRYKDSGAGFLIEVDSQEPSQTYPSKIVKEPDTLEHCENCDKEILDSFLRMKFDLNVCDSCRKEDEKYDFITRTDAKNEFLLKDCDFDKRPPPLKFLLRKNPHHERGSHMRLYLRCQVEARALEVWGSEEGLEEARERRRESSYKRKKNAMSKKLKDLRKQNRAAVVVKSKMTAHAHTFGPEVPSEAGSDTYVRVCIECGFKESYEKM